MNLSGRKLNHKKMKIITLFRKVRVFIIFFLINNFNFKYSKLIMRLFFFLISLIFYFYHESLNANQPYDNDLNEKKLICYNKSQSIDDWGIKFLSNKKVILYSLDKFIYELYEHKRSYRTDKRNIEIFNGSEVEILINRKTLKFANKKCSLTNEDPLILLKKRIQELKESKTKNNLL